MHAFSLPRPAGVWVCLAMLATSRGRGQVQDEALRRGGRNWPTANYSDRDAEFATKVRDQIEQELDAGNDFISTLGRGVMNSSRARCQVRSWRLSPCGRSLKR